jgi:DNA-binding NtrC family response regulator
MGYTEQQLSLKSYCGEMNIPSQIMVVDRLGGPASILMDTVSRLMDCTISITFVENRTEAARALECACFDLVVIGVEESHQLALISYIREQFPDLPIIVGGRNPSDLFIERAKQYGALETLRVPNRAAELRELVTRFGHQYLGQR